MYYLINIIVLNRAYQLLDEDTKKEQRKLLEVLCLLALRHASRARMREEKMCNLRLLY